MKGRARGPMVVPNYHPEIQPHLHVGLFRAGTDNDFNADHREQLARYSKACHSHLKQ